MRIGTSKQGRSFLVGSTRGDVNGDASGKLVDKPEEVDAVLVEWAV